MKQKDGLWITDEWDKRNGRSLTVKIKKVIESYRSKFQQIDVYETECFGKLFMLDGTIMCTQFDEFAYHEMITHVPLSVHPNPKKILIIGGGDGGVVREVLKYSSVEEVHLCEIDEEVINVSKKHFPDVASGFDSPKLKVFVQDGAAFVKEKKDYYDIIIVDSSDPWGPAEVLFKKQFYQNMFDALKKDGIVVTQSESMYYNRDIIKKMCDFNKEIYPVVSYYYALVPTYPSGTIGFSFCSKKYHPIKDAKDKKISGLKYYTSDVHKAAFVLPNFMKGVL